MGGEDGVVKWNVFQEQEAGDGKILIWRGWVEGAVLLLINKRRLLFEGMASQEFQGGSKNGNSTCQS